MGVLFLDLGQELELDCSALENASLHIFDELFLFLAEQFILKLHPVNLFFHSDDLCLTNGRVKSVLHLFL